MAISVHLEASQADTCLQGFLRRGKHYTFTDIVCCFKLHTCKSQMLHGMPHTARLHAFTLVSVMGRAEGNAALTDRRSLVPKISISESQLQL